MKAVVWGLIWLGSIATGVALFSLGAAVEQLTAPQPEPLTAQLSIFGASGAIILSAIAAVLKREQFLRVFFCGICFFALSLLVGVMVGILKIDEGIGYILALSLMIAGSLAVYRGMKRPMDKQ